MEILEDFFKSVAKAIRKKTGKKKRIKAEDFAKEIRAIPTRNLQEKDISLTSTEAKTITPDSRYEALSKVNVTPKLRSDASTVPAYSTNVTTVMEGYAGISSVYKKANAADRAVSITSTGTTTVGQDPNNNTSAISSATITPSLQAKTGSLTSNTTTTYTPDSGYCGMKSVAITTNISNAITYSCPWIYGNSTFTNTLSVPSAKTQAYLVVYAVTTGSYDPLSITGSNCTLSRINTDAYGTPYTEVNNSKRHTTFIYKVTKNAGVTGTITIKSTSTALPFTGPVLIY